jgi:hypothetical protein
MNQITQAQALPQEKVDSAKRTSELGCYINVVSS